MSSDDIVHYMALDFSMYLGEVLGLDDAPAEAFFDPISTVFGDDLMQESVIVGFHSKDGATKLATELNSWLETDAVTPAMARNLLEVTITNNFGADALE